MSEESPKRGVYISGRISSDPRYFRQRFARAEARLRTQGWRRVYNPAALTDAVGYEDYGSALRFDVGLILSSCEAIYMLRRWRESPGALVEWLIAEAIGLEILYEDPKDRHGDFTFGVWPSDAVTTAAA